MPQIPAVSAVALEREIRIGLGSYLSEAQLRKVLSQAEIFSPEIGRRCWSGARLSGEFQKPSLGLNAGLYYILQGRARLLDDQESLLTTLQVGDVFGGQSLFPEASFLAYSVRASQNLVFARIPATALVPFFAGPGEQDSALRTYLYQEALVQDLQLLCQQQAELQMIDPSDLRQVLRQAAVYSLPVGRLRSGVGQTSPLAEGGLWVVRLGSLLHSASGRRLSAGAILLPADCPELREASQWLVEQPTELCSINAEQWKALQTGDPVIQFPSKHSEPNHKGRPRGKTKQKPRQPVQKPFSEQVGQAYFPSPRVRAWHVWQSILKQYPFVAQQSAVDCGVACLAMIGQFWGKQFDINQLRLTANVDRSGTSLKGLVQAAESVGFSARPVQASLEQLAKQQLPAIAHWEGKHFIVVYRITARKIYLCDPAIGRLQLTPKAFQQGWTGYTVLLQTTAFLAQAPEVQRDLGRFVSIIRPHFPVLFEVLVASLMVQALGLFMPLLTQMLLDRVVTQRSESTFVAVSIGLAIFSVFSVLMRSLRRYLLYHTANKIDLSLITGFINHTLRLPLNYFETRYVGDITSRVQENSKIRSFLTGEAITTLLDVLMLFVYVGLMLWYSWQMTLVALMPIPLFLVITLATTPILQRISRETFAAKTTEGSYLIETLNGISTIKSMGLERSVRWRWEGLFHKFIRIKFSGRMVRERIDLVSNLIETIAANGLMILGVWLVLQQRLTIGQLFAFNMLVGRVLSPFQRLISLWNDFQEILIAVERLDDVINTSPEESIQSTLRISLPPLLGKIRFENVSFRYNTYAQANTLEGISFEVSPGQTIALVGRSGSGKTTISKLVLGLYMPTSGRIWIDDFDLATVSLESLRQQVGVVDQNTFLFGGTIRENIAIAKSDTSLAVIRKAAQLAGAAEFIEAMPMQYDTQIGEGGGMLSGGQRQRLAIARALLDRPRLLILDEATSSLDAESERIIQTNLGQIFHQQTTLIIAHRLSTVRHADLILVLDNGIIVERGTHEILMEKRGHYYYLNQQQFT